MEPAERHARATTWDLPRVARHDQHRTRPNPTRTSPPARFVVLLARRLSANEVRVLLVELARVSRSEGLSHTSAVHQPEAQRNEYNGGYRWGRQQGMQQHRASCAHQGASRERSTPMRASVRSIRKRENAPRSAGRCRCAPRRNKRTPRFEIAARSTWSGARHPAGIYAPRYNQDHRPVPRASTSRCERLCRFWIIRRGESTERQRRTEEWEQRTLFAASGALVASVRAASPEAAFVITRPELSSRRTRSARVRPTSVAAPTHRSGQRCGTNATGFALTSRSTFSCEGRAASGEGRAASGKREPRRRR